MQLYIAGQSIVQVQSLLGLLILTPTERGVKQIKSAKIKSIEVVGDEYRISLDWIKVKVGNKYIGDEIPDEIIVRAESSATDQHFPLLVKGVDKNLYIFLPEAVE